jgi:hypothetical protein
MDNAVIVAQRVAFQKLYSCTVRSSVLLLLLQLLRVRLCASVLITIEKLLLLLLQSVNRPDSFTLAPLNSSRRAYTTDYSSLK